MNPGPAGTGTNLACNQHLVDTCCQWGGNNQALPGYTRFGCNKCLADAQQTGFRQHLLPAGNAKCSAADIAFFCDSLDWNHQMNAVQPNTFTLPTQADCNTRYAGFSMSDKAPQASITNGVINPPSTAPAKCIGNTAANCPSHCTFLNKACLDLSGSCDQGSVANNGLTARGAEKVCTNSLSGCLWNAALQTCTVAPAPATPPASGGSSGGGSCSGLSKKNCKKTAGCVFSNKACSTAPAAPAPGTACDQIKSGKTDCLAALDAAGASMNCQYKKKKCSAAPAPVPAGSCAGLAKKACKKAGCTFQKNTCSGGSGGSSPAPPSSGSCSGYTVKKDCTKMGCSWNKRKNTCK